MSTKKLYNHYKHQTRNNITNSPTKIRHPHSNRASHIVSLCYNKQIVIRIHTSCNAKGACTSRVRRTTPTAVAVAVVRCSLVMGQYIEISTHRFDIDISYRVVELNIDIFDILRFIDLAAFVWRDSPSFRANHG